MSSKNEYVMNLAKELLGFEYYGTVATMLCLAVFVVSLCLVLRRHRPRDAYMAKPPLNQIE